MRKVLLSLLVALSFTLTATAQDRVITGKITDDKSLPVSGVSVVPSDGKGGTQTDGNGNYKVTVSASVKSITFSRVGFESKTNMISGAVMNVDLVSSTQKLEDVVITGYSTVKKKEFTGAATVLGNKAVDNIPVGSFDQMLQGKAPGLLVNSGSGQPGAQANLRIRGTSSLAGQGQPLYIVDGVPLNANDLAGLNPNDFESVTVLKDASASAIYGSRGGLGVIVITTKRGKVGQANFTVRQQYGLTQRPQSSNFNQLDSKGQLQYEEFVGGYAPGLTSPGWVYSAKNPANAALPATSPTPFSPSRARYAFLLDSLGNNNVNYYDLLFKTGVSRTTELSMSGGTNTSRYFSSINNFSQEGTDRKSKLDRYTVRLNLDNTAGKLSSRFSSSLGYTKTIYNEGAFYGANGTANPFAMVWRAKPYENPFRPDGSIIFGASTPLVTKQLGSLIERSDNSQWTENLLKLNTGLDLSYKILPTVTLRNNVGIDAAMYNAQGSIGANSFVGSLQLFQAGLLDESSLSRLQMINTTSLIFNKKFADKHNVEVSANFEAIRQWNKGTGFRLFNLDPRVIQTGQGAGTLVTNGATTMAQNGNSAKSGFGIRSFFGTMQYTYDGRYTISGNVRRDGTSRILNDVNKEIDSYSAGITWNTLNEKFMENQNIFSDLSFRASYGASPNIGSIPAGAAFGLNSLFYSIPKYVGAQLENFTPVGFAGSASTAVVPSVANNELRIETVNKANIGIDVGFFKERIHLTVDAYKNTTKDLFVSKNLPATSGFYGTALPVNAGTLVNEGVEFDLTVEAVRQKNFGITLRANHSINDNTIEDLGGVTEYLAGTFIIREGISTGTHFTIGYLGADPATGLPIYKRPNGTPTTNVAEAGQFADYGSFIPKHQGGFSGAIRLYRFSIEAQFSYQLDVNRSNNAINFVTQGNVGNTGAVTQSADLLNSQWRKPGDTRLLSGPAYTRGFTSYDIGDAKFLRFRNLNMSYQIPEIGIGGRRLIKSSRFYVQAQNIFIWSPWKGLDPEDDNNISLGEFPNPKSVVVGIDINF